MAEQVHMYTCENPRSVRPRAEYLLTVKELKPKLLHRREDFDDMDTYRHTIVVPYHLRDIPLALLRDSIEYEYSSHGCWHERDCCGCRVAYPRLDTLRRVRRGVYSFLQNSGNNY